MGDKHFGLAEALGFGWNTMRANFWCFAGLGLLAFGVSTIPTIVDLIARPLVPEAILALRGAVTTLLSWVVGLTLGIGFIKIVLGFCDGRKLPVETLFAVRDCFWRYLGVTILYSLIVVGFFLLCTVVAMLLVKAQTTFACMGLPLVLLGIVLALRFGVEFCFCFYFVVDKGLGPVQALTQLPQLGVKIVCFSARTQKVFTTFPAFLFRSPASKRARTGPAVGAVRPDDRWAE